MMKSRRGAKGAEIFVETLNGLGVDRIFLNPGIDLVPLMVTLAQCKASERKAPRVTLCTDESVAVAAAHGSAMVTGKPQMVAVFEDVGLLQGGGAIVNLKYGRMPVVLVSGTNSIPRRTNWRGEPADQRGIIRDYVKWDHEITTNEDISSVLAEAFRVASVEPCGPVYVAIGEGVLSAEPGSDAVAAPKAADPAPKPDGVDLQRASEILIAAENPLIMAAYSGRHPESVALLVDLAEMVGARVITTDLRMNFPSTHPLCPGIDSILGGTYDHYIAEADALLLVDYDFPGPIGKRFAPRADARIVQIDMEPLKNGAPLWGRHADVLIRGDSAAILRFLNAVIRPCLTQDKVLRIRGRCEGMGREHESVKAEFRAKAAAEAGKRPLSPDWLCLCINEAIDDDAVIVHMLPSNGDALSRQIRRTRPGTMFSWGDNAGSMGWPLGAALGAKLAAPDKMVVSLIGDGGFIYGCPVATLWGAAAYHAPFLTIIFNNQSYAIFRESASQLCDERLVTGDMGFEVGIDIKNPPDFAAVARACNAYGQTVEEPYILPSALRSAIDEVQRGRSAVLDVKIQG